MKEQTKQSKKIYECSFMTLYEDEVVLPNQKISQRVYIKHPGAAAILPITKEGQIILIKQYRYPLGMESLEIPAGKKEDIHEDSTYFAHRELEEETGYVSDDMTFFQRMYPCVGYSDEYIDLFIAKNCVKKDHPKAMDDDENIEPLFLTKDEVKTMIEMHQIKDGKTLIMLHAYLLAEKS